MEDHDRCSVTAIWIDSISYCVFSSSVMFSRLCWKLTFYRNNRCTTEIWVLSNGLRWVFKSRDAVIISNSKCWKGSNYHSANTAISRIKINLNILRPRQNGHHFSDDISKCIFWVKMYKFPLRFHWNLLPWVNLQHSSIEAGAKPLSEPMLVYLTFAASME